MLTRLRGPVATGVRRAPAGDRGVTLIEVVVSMSIMTLFMAMFTVGMVQLYRSANKSEAVGLAQSQINIAFLRLDKELRYAAGISVPGQVGADPYVEYLVTSTGAAVCSQLRLQIASAQLQRRTWIRGSVPLNPGPWTVLASNISSPAPFTLHPSDATFSHQRLQLSFTATTGPATAATTRTTDVTFTALNTSMSTTSTSVCTEGRSIP